MVHAQGRPKFKRGTTLIQLRLQPSAAYARAFHGARPPRITRAARAAGFTREAQGGEFARPSARSHRPPALLKTTCATLPVIAFVLQIASCRAHLRRRAEGFTAENSTGSAPVSYADYCIQCRQKSQAVSRICALRRRIFRRRRSSSRSPSSGRRSAPR